MSVLWALVSPAVPGNLCPARTKEPGLAGWVMRGHAMQGQTVPADAPPGWGFLLLLLLTFWIKYVFVVGSAVHCGVFSSIYS